MTTVTERIDPGLDLVSLHALDPERYPCLLDSAATGSPQGRFDILFALPQHVMWLDRRWRLHGAPPGSSTFLDGLDRWWQHERTTPPENDEGLPYRSGWFVYLGYELAGQVEPILRLRTGAGWPIAFATRCAAALIRDHERGTLTLVADREESLPLILADIGRVVVPPRGPVTAVAAAHEEPAGQFIAAVRRAQELIRAGDIFQANLSREWRAPVVAPLADALLYRRLRAANPGPFAGLVRWRDNAILSSSPERLLRVAGRRADTRPIAGTRPRGSSTGQDAHLSRELLGHPKERAEHIMLIDLERNDLGRVCRPGTVVVDEFMVVESYAHVHHIVSNVTGMLRDEVTPGQAIAAVFPGGTITGCPKVRCMEIIAELEQAPRGAYTGSIGYLDRCGNLDLNILIRTLVRSGSRLSLRAGAGIVADSVPEAEVEETRAKARGLLLALGSDPS